jgi:hypothetical protein
VKKLFVLDRLVKMLVKFVRLHFGVVTYKISRFPNSFNYLELTPETRLWSAYCGRPSFFADWDITIRTPQEPSSGTDEYYHSVQHILLGVQRNIVILSKQCSKILSSIYSQRHKGDQRGLQTTVQTIHNDLVKWHTELSPKLSWPNENGTPTSPQVLMLQ